MSRNGTTQVLDHANLRISDAANEGPLKTPGRRGLDIRNPNVLKTAEKSKLGLSGTATPSRMAPVQIRAPLKSKLIVFEDAASPVNEKEADEEDDEEIDTCAPLTNGERTMLLKSMRADHTILPDEDLELEDYEDDEEKEEEEGGVERYFKSVYNLADNFDALWEESTVEAHDSDTEIETCELNTNQGPEYELAQWRFFVEKMKEREIQLVEDDEYLAMEKKWAETEGCWSDEENDENNQSI
ncbi:hypothetical protein PRIPAC_73750 [Pristionchus pacificus]|uniref:Uncharacterized protein n=1 Tax=Pristionchus pacificus TaxID=54126 RepID=A0A2A6CFN8_PRIPA|nr:hypothetical protein PRIPAC_73750 [Pristionchus pacificus]|eukprot:PDM76898.1 hypothetical protein PRIPAC_42293 [Pristionchus pacificus]